MAQEIKFGTDGWRGVIADDFTFENVRRVARAIASYVLKYEEPQHGVVVGYDTRFASPRAARIVAEVPVGIPRDARGEAEIAAIKAGLARRAQGDRAERDVS